MAIVNIWDLNKYPNNGLGEGGRQKGPQRQYTLLGGALKDVFWWPVSGQFLEFKYLG